MSASGIGHEFLALPSLPLAALGAALVDVVRVGQLPTNDTPAMPG
jgi:hypothetical protein